MTLSVNEREFCATSVLNGLRLDGRKMNQYRTVHLGFFDDLGAVECTLGDTRVFAKTTCDCRSPAAERPTEGFLHFECKLSSMASLDYESGRTSTEGIMLSRTLEKLFRSSRALDTEGLCIVAGKLVWSINVEIEVLNDDGNLIDCACMAVMSSLLHYRRPDVTVTGEDVVIHSVMEKNPVPLTIHHTPLCVTFALFGNGETWAMDPTRLEGSVKTGEILIGINPFKEVCLIVKPGGVDIEMDQVYYLCNMSFETVCEMMQSLQNQIKDDIQKRNIETNSFAKKRK